MIIVFSASRGYSSWDPSASGHTGSTSVRRQRSAAAFWLGPLIARFRDVDPLLESILRMMAFFTPIFWMVD